MHKDDGPGEMPLLNWAFEMTHTWGGKKNHLKLFD